MLKKNKKNIVICEKCGKDLSKEEKKVAVVAAAEKFKKSLFSNHIDLSIYTVTLEVNGGELSSDFNSYEYGIGASLPIPTRNGYTFAGWYSDSALKTAYTFDKMPAQNITLYAKWNANEYTYNIVYKSNSGVSLGTATVKGAFDSSTTVTPKAFTGYTSPASQTVKFDSTTAKTITFTYTPIEYKITYTLNSGSVSGNPTTYTIETATITLKNPTRTGYTFAGWTGTGLSSATIAGSSYLTSRVSLPPVSCLTTPIPV